MTAKFFRCKHCGNIIMSVENSGVPVICCGEPMELLVGGTVDASKEKHVPVYTIEGDIVQIKVGEVEHPSSKEHYIQWIGLSTDRGVRIEYLKPQEKPEACFKLCCGEKADEIFCYCNLHGLWRKQVVV